MNAHTSAPPSATLVRIADQMESFRENLRKVSRTGTAADLANQFIRDAQIVFPNASLRFLHASPGSGQWEVLAGDAGSKSTAHLPRPSDDDGKSSAVHSEKNELTVSQTLADGSRIRVVLVNMPAQSQISDTDELSLRVLTGVLETIYGEMLHRRNEKAMLFSLNHRILQLNSLIDTGIEIATIDPHALPHRLALVRAISLTNASTGMVRVSDANAVLEEYRFPEHSSRVKDGKSIQSGFEFSGRTYVFEISDKESRSGVIPFEETDQMLLDALTKQVHASLENRHLHEQAIENERIERELSVAASIQRKIIPLKLPAVPGYEIAGINIPSRSVGGDYYDCIPLPDKRYALIIADVSGKGVPAALLVSSLHAYLTAYLEGNDPLPALAGKLNKALFRASTEDRFVTALLALLTPATGDIEYLSAGHNPAYILKSDHTIEELKLGGIPLGMLDADFPYQSEHRKLTPGEGLLLYTDGVTEAENERHELYEQAHSLSGFLASRRPERAESFIGDLISEIRSHTGSASQNDDITAMYLIRKS
ncbi:MAG TPA: PP2C family protein-serine/threonine phosphatase [Bacteroidota bacterium]|nr:PP2C family protein-serine/threonine phosphatase [Bacteroidota bacterium]